MVPKPHDAPALRLQTLRTRGIARKANLIRMLATIEFNDQTSFNACEVGNEYVDRVLATKFPPIQLTGAQVPPEQALGVGLIGTQGARVLHPHPYPLPLAGEGASHSCTGHCPLSRVQERVGVRA